ncbi:uncharacterized protein BDZ99DRAFT_40835 [Mytilinidion resinicola]|uniref:Uncharacterized protein n=1 Tax=Mytilinidion resinicola TaxID=574789 RepID=A0A6A6YJ69_9PEZI|nr:uncharacterized protein BDZ99DRAFT_40835 [Mytilinidion resinicola]KAF2808851.1 hypothetical protein BDZ99DRAFT_40835 [Mytilinidion resinicola]
MHLCVLGMFIIWLHPKYFMSSRITCLRPLYVTSVVGYCIFGESRMLCRFPRPVIGLPDHITILWIIYTLIYLFCLWVKIFICLGS